MSFPRKPLVNVRKIAVLRANALGDFLFTLPALEALRARYPAAEIVLLARQWHADFLKGRPGPIDRVVVIPACRGVGIDMDGIEDQGELEQFFLRMREEHFDLACQLHGGGRYSNPFIQRLEAGLTIGLKAPEAISLDRWVPYVYFQHEILRYLEVVSLVGATTCQMEPQITVTDNDLYEADRFLPFDTQTHPLIALHAGASDSRRRWPTENFAAVGDVLAQQGARIVLTGTEGEKHLTRAISEAMEAPAIDLAGCISLGGLAALLSRCQLVISNDTGPLHLTNAVGTPSVGIYWCFNLVTAAALMRSHHRPITSWQLCCPVCGVDATKGTCIHTDSFVADISTQEVIEAARELLHTSPLAASFHA